MLEMQYHVSVNMEVRMAEIIIYVLSASRLCSWSSLAALDNLSFSYSANPSSIWNIRDLNRLSKWGRPNCKDFEKSS